jgi:sterol desaturase/sphingolipid hydroxylase (fatty acid hydroxylase superfamily)
MIIIVAFVLMAVEYLFHRVNHLTTHDAGETAASLAIAIGHKVMTGSLATILAVPALFVYRHRLFNIPTDSVWAWGALFLGVELSFYLHHLVMHKIRWFWASHAVHHSATKMNLSVGVRLGWGGDLTGGFLFYLPLVLLGFHPVAVFGMLGLGLFYQFFLHVACPPKLGPLEWILNTPRHHHVHHASNAECLDKNFGSVLILFDRLFGTFAEAPKTEEMKFGLAGIAPTRNPVMILLGGWSQIARALRQTEGLMAKLRLVFGWQSIR